ncbi:chloramphenicol phosphotransferase CPT family protein [Enterovibrio norvegicus]|uniref:Chloramphenicol phosphotransferase n=1 Tax=Enterovibrio norvegicus TaxID=188144 RepID=A0A2N7L3I7_9GAMM|nr:AAA family ATPase [Enterovibrio norvegicus]PML82071.1 chloramphenicol phosphotransferase [Enterovibrio norvegicus]PMN74097.1 chloramphenicol phosphotransferase [Enterovibrio norvegicus]PMN87450.1 chloramphenicol phosphotransferase [Enterovibrio norvegicus]
MFPNVIVLNGTGSAGKTSIAKSLIEMLPRQYLNFSIDSVLYALPPSDLQKMMDGKAITRDGYNYSTLIEGYHQAASGLAKAGCFLILDNAWTLPTEKLNMLNALSGFSVCLVGVKCDLRETSERERQRGDRAIGLAESEFNLVHQHLTYDIELDTTFASAEQAAKNLLVYLKEQDAYNGAQLSRENLAR